ncbi:MAG: hypothetical protein ACPIE8_05900, partial [Henriciella sp.]
MRSTIFERETPRTAATHEGQRPMAATPEGRRPDRVQSEQAVATLKAQLNEAKGTLKEAEAKATEFAKEYGKEFYLRKQIAEQLQEMTGGLRVFCRVR